jgi:hypothetical protein
MYVRLTENEKHSEISTGTNIPILDILHGHCTLGISTIKLSYDLSTTMC